MLKKLLSLLSDAGVYGLSTVAGQLVSFLLLPLYTRHLSPADYGTLAMLNVALMLMHGLVPLGVTDAIFRRLSLCRGSNEQHRELSTALWSVIGSTLVFLAGGCLLAPQISSILIGESSAANLVRLTLLTATLMAFGEVPRCALRASRRVWIIALTSLGKVLVTISLTIYAVVGLEMGVLGYVLAGLASESLFVAAYFVPVIRSFGFSFSKTAWRAMISYGLPILPHRSLMFITLMFGNYTVRRLLGLEQAGLYDMANKFALPVGVVINAFQSAWQPFKFEIHANDEDPAAFFRSTFTYYVAFTSCMWVIGSCWLPDVLRLMTASAFHTAALLVPIVLLARVLMGVYFMLGSGIELSDNTRPLALISTVGLTTVAALSYLLIPVLGAGGAAFANAAGWVTMSVVAFKIAASRINIAYEWKFIAPIVVLASAFTILSWELQATHLPIRLVIQFLLGGCYPLLVLLLLLRYSDESPRIRKRLTTVLSNRRDTEAAQAC